jgi:hypothetical protein
MGFTIRISARSIAIAIALGFTLVLVLSVAADTALAAASDIVINEIMYNPESDFDTDEFLEIHHTGAESVDIGGWCVDGASFCFPAGTTIAALSLLTTSHRASDEVTQGSAGERPPRLALCRC